MLLPTKLLKLKNMITSGKQIANSGVSDGSLLVNNLLSLPIKLVVGTCCVLVVVGLVFAVVLFSKFQIFQGVDTAYANSGGASSMNASNYLEWAVNIANDDSHGYSQCNRTGPDYDCSSLVWYSLVNAGGFSAEQLGGYAFSTYGMPSILTGAGFKEYTYTGVDALQPGDILLRDGHTEIYYGEGKTVGAHRAEGGGICGAAGDQDAGEIDVSDMYGSWSTYYRLEG